MENTSSERAVAGKEPAREDDQNFLRPFHSYFSGLFAGGDLGVSDRRPWPPSLQLSRAQKRDACATRDLRG